MSEDEIKQAWEWIHKSFGAINQASYKIDAAVESMHKKVDDSMRDVYGKIDDMDDKISSTQTDIAVIKTTMVTGDRADEIIQNHVDACDHTPIHQSLLGLLRSKTLWAVVSTVAGAGALAWFGLSG